MDHGSLHDDDPAGDILCKESSDCGMIGGDNGYADDLDCGVRSDEGGAFSLSHVENPCEGQSNGTRTKLALVLPCS